MLFMSASIYRSQISRQIIVLLIIVLTLLIQIFQHHHHLHQAEASQQQQQHHQRNTNNQTCSNNRTQRVTQDDHLIAISSRSNDNVVQDELDRTDEGPSVDSQESQNDDNDNSSSIRQAPQAGGGRVSGFFGQVAKTVIYGSAAWAQLNSPILCPLLKHETDKDNEDQPILFAFNNNLNKEQAYRIYSDDEITEQMIEEAQFDPKQMTLIYVHGWLGGIHKELWLSEAKNAALENSFLSRHNEWMSSWSKADQDGWSWRPQARDGVGNSAAPSSSSSFRPNVIIVDWSEFASGTLYTATENSLKVSRRLARLLSYLAGVGGLQPNLMHCLGHSIGTHICGQAARKAFPITVAGGAASSSESPKNPPERRFGHITGLDPGGFCYELNIKNETTFLGLRPSDALLVDAYYSNRSPFGNRYQVAQYNVRINNGFFQRPCSVWKYPAVAREYFRAAMRHAFGGTLGQGANNEILTCDHYFATRFASQLPPTLCSYVGYHCDSYRNYLRGKCGLCESASQCYSMNFEYQVTNPSIEHALKHIRTHSSFYLGSGSGSKSATNSPPGGVPYEERRSYHMRITEEEPYCSLTFRVRVALEKSIVDLRSFRAEWLKLRFFSSSVQANNSLMVKDADRGGRKVDLLPLHGPWFATAIDEVAAAETGLDDRTLTALFELDPGALQRALRSPEESPIGDIQVEYNNQFNRRHDPLSNPIDFIQLDYLSSTDLRTRSKFSRRFSREQFSIIYKHLESNNVAAVIAASAASRQDHV